MKYLIKLKDLIKRGALRIFPNTAEIFVRIFVWISSLAKAIPQIILPKANCMSAFLLGLLFLILVGCSTSRQMTTQLVHDVSRDTFYMSNTQYDSIYIFKDKLTDRTKDTIYVKDISVEYRYKLLKDTIRVVERDSIPYQVTVTETKEITRPLTWFDHLTRLVFWFIFGYLLSVIVFKLKSILPHL